jgi:hypothetical protein
MILYMTDSSKVDFPTPITSLFFKSMGLLARNSKDR